MIFKKRASLHVNRKFFELLVGHGFHIAMLNDHGWTMAGPIWLVYDGLVRLGVGYTSQE